MWSCSTFAAARASRTNRARACSSAAQAWKTFNATTRCNCLVEAPDDDAHPAPAQDRLDAIRADPAEVALAIGRFKAHQDGRPAP